MQPIMDGHTVTPYGGRSNGDDVDGGGAVRVRDGGTLVLLDCALVLNTAARGGAVFAAGGGARVVGRDTLFVNNAAPDGFGGALYASDGAQVSSGRAAAWRNVPCNVTWHNGTSGGTFTGGRAGGLPPGVVCHAT